MRILDKNEIQDMPTESWERMAYEDLKKKLLPIRNVHFHVL